MIIKIQKIGNSKGIILPKQMMDLCAIKDHVSIGVEGNRIVIAPIDEPRAGWEAQFKTALNIRDKPEHDFSGGMENTFDQDEWTW